MLRTSDHPPGIPAQVGNRATDASSFWRRQGPAAPAPLALLSPTDSLKTHTGVPHSPLHVETREMSTSFKSSIFMVLGAVTANISSVSGKREQKRLKHMLLERQSPGLRCGKQSIYDNAAFFSCPRPYDDPGKVYCCGGGKFQGGSYCCTQIEHGVNKIGDR